MTTAFVGDYGYTITVDCGQDISDATGLEILLSKPNVSTKVTKTGTLSGTNAVVCTVADGDIDAVGTWEVQAKVTTASGVFHSTINTLIVEAVL